MAVIETNKIKCYNQKEKSDNKKKISSMFFQKINIF